MANKQGNFIEVIVDRTQNTDMMINAQILTGLTEQHLVKRDDGFLLHHLAADPFKRMCYAAKLDGLHIKIVSAFRSYERQASIWQSKATGARAVYDLQGNIIDIQALDDKQKLAAILLYSALPGASRHHWGTELDIYDSKTVDDDYKPQLSPAEYQMGGPFYPLVMWLNKHAHKYGFFMPYKTYQNGVAAEPWHISYKPVSEPYLAEFNTEILRQSLVSQPIALQEQVLQELDSLFKQYVKNICKV